MILNLWQLLKLMNDNTPATDRTVISQIDSETLSLLRAIVANAMPRLQWRHSGLGMLQAYILEGNQQEVRVHVWHPSLKLPGIDGAGLGHDHRFDMTSCVLTGQLTHVEILTSPDPAGDWKVYEVVNARKALMETGTQAGEFRLIEETVRITKHAMPISAGSVYFFPKSSFHETQPDSQFVITLALKTNQHTSPARVLCRVGREPLNAYGTPLPKTQCDLILAEAKTILHNAASVDTYGDQARLVISSCEQSWGSSEYLYSVLEKVISSAEAPT